MACGVQGPSYGKHATPTSSSSSPISTGGSGLGTADGSGGPTEFATSMAAVLASALNQGMFGATGWVYYTIYRVRVEIGIIYIVGGGKVGKRRAS